MSDGETYLLRVERDALRAEVATLRRHGELLAAAYVNSLDQPDSPRTRLAYAVFAKIETGIHPALLAACAAFLGPEPAHE